MKKLFYLGLFGLITLLASCVKEIPPAPTGEAKVSFVNAVETSAPQNMFINGAKPANSVPLAYGSYSPYFTFASGDNAFAFANSDVTDGVGNAGIGASVEIGANISVYYFKKLQIDGAGLTAGVVYDDITPVEGKAKVRFIHLNNNLDNFIDISIDSGAVLNTGIAFTVSSAYYTVEPGTKFKANSSDLTEPLLFDPDVKAGKNYTIWFDGTDTTLKYHTILQN